MIKKERPAETDVPRGSFLPIDRVTYLWYIKVIDIYESFNLSTNHHHRRIPMAKEINVVFEYTEVSTTHAGVRYYATFHSDEEVEEQQRLSQEPGSRTKIVAIGMTDEEATDLCHTAMINGGFDSRRAAIETDTEMPDEMKEMELRQLEMLKRLGGWSEFDCKF